MSGCCAAEGLSSLLYRYGEFRAKPQSYPSIQATTLTFAIERESAHTLTQAMDFFDFLDSQARHRFLQAEVFFRVDVEDQLNREIWAVSGNFAYLKQRRSYPSPVPEHSCT